MHQVHAIGILKSSVELDNILMKQRSMNIYLSHNLLDVEHVEAVPVVHLQGHRDPGLGTYTVYDGTESAFAEYFLDL